MASSLAVRAWWIAFLWPSRLSWNTRVATACLAWPKCRTSKCSLGSWKTQSASKSHSLTRTQGALLFGWLSSVMQSDEVELGVSLTNDLRGQSDEQFPGDDYNSRMVACEKVGNGDVKLLDIGGDGLHIQDEMSTVQLRRGGASLSDMGIHSLTGMSSASASASDMGDHSTSTRVIVATQDDWNFDMSEPQRGVNLAGDDLRGQPTNEQVPGNNSDMVACDTVGSGDVKLSSGGDDYDIADEMSTVQQRECGASLSDGGDHSLPGVMCAS